MYKTIYKILKYVKKHRGAHSTEILNALCFNSKIDKVFQNSLICNLLHIQNLFHTDVTEAQMLLKHCEKENYIHSTGDRYYEITSEGLKYIGSMKSNFISHWLPYCITTLIAIIALFK